jgi:hypothetical protein
MRYGLSLLTALAWALWLGGLIALFILVTDLFKVDRPTAVVAAPRMFLHFERFQLLFAAVALLAAGGWRLREQRMVLNVLFTFLAIATVALVINAAVITPKMEQIRVAGDSSGPQFRKLHGQSMAIHSLQAMALLLAGLTLPAAMGSPKTASEAAAPTTPPAAPSDLNPSP